MFFCVVEMAGVKKDYDIGRCNPCKFAKEVVGSGQWKFLGCYFPPHRGKWVAEIKNCPLYHEAEKRIME